MNALKKSLFLLILPVLIFPLLASSTLHKFYMSVTNVAYSEKDSAIQITSRIFIDDMEDALQERYGFESKLATEKEPDETDAYLEKYLRTKFIVEVNGEKISYNFIGKKYETDVMICYIEVPDVDLANIKSIQIENEILTDVFDEQQNIVHFDIEGNKNSFILSKSDTKGMLNL